MEAINRKFLTANAPLGWEGLGVYEVSAGVVQPVTDATAQEPVGIVRSVSVLTGQTNDLTALICTHGPCPMKVAAAGLTRGGSSTVAANGGAGEMAAAEDDEWAIGRVFLSQNAAEDDFVQGYVDINRPRADAA